MPAQKRADRCIDTRNLFLTSSNRWRVLVWRRGEAHPGGHHLTHEAAIAARDALEASLPPASKPWSIKGRPGRQDPAEYRRARVKRLRDAKLCVTCGDPADAYNCADCRRIRRAKYVPAGKALQFR